MAADGISRLVAVTTMKTDNANDDALHGADKQRSLVNQQRLVRAAQQKLDELSRSDKRLDSGEQARTEEIWDNLNDAGIAVNYSYSFQGDGSHGDIDNDAHKANAEMIDSMKQELENAMKDLEAEDRLGNFEIQRLMSQYNQSENLASSVQKKKDSTADGTIGKIN